MNGEQLLDALEQVDEELLVEAERVRQRRKKALWPLIPLAACLCLVVAGAMIAQPWRSVPQSNSLPGKGESNQAETEHGSVGVYVPPMEVPMEGDAQIEADMLSFFIYQGRLYVECSRAQNGADLVGEKLGTSNGRIDEWTPDSGYVEGSGTAWGDFYAVNGYDPSHLLCMTWEDGTVALYWNNNDIVVETAGDVLNEVFHMSGQVVKATMQGADVEAVTEISHLDGLNAWVEELCATPAQWDGDSPSEVLGYLYLENQDGVTVQLALQEGGTVGMWGLGTVSFQLDWMPLTQWKA